ncbi:MAG: IS3 family transposase [Actinomycetota bacterium]
MIGPIRGRRLAAEIKHRIMRAVEDAKAGGFTIDWACGVIQLDARRYRRWARRREEAVGSRSPAPSFADPGASQGLVDRPPVARVRPHALTSAERAEILAAADEDTLAHLRHRKLTHHLSRGSRVFCSESSTLRVLRAAGKIPHYVPRSRPVRPRPELDVSEPNRGWRYDGTRFPTIAGDYHLIPIIDGCSRKIMGRYFGPEFTSRSVQAAWDKALAGEGLLADEVERLPAAGSDRGTQMTSRSTKAFFAELGITQSFSRARVPTDNATAESWIATLKCERLYEADTAEMTPDQVESMIDRFIDYYNNERLHQSLGFVTPAERHEGRHVAIIQARRRGMQEARERRRMHANGGAGISR